MQDENLVVNDIVEAIKKDREPRLKTHPTKWKKGESGNPKGRPKGSKNAVTIFKEAVLSESEEVILKHFPKVVKVVCDKAMEGDLTAAKMLFDRLIPVRKAVEPGAEKERGGVNIIIQGMKVEETVIEATPDEESCESCNDSQGDVVDEQTHTTESEGRK